MESTQSLLAEKTSFFRNLYLIISSHGEKIFCFFITFALLLLVFSLSITDQLFLELTSTIKHLKEAKTQFIS